MIWNTLSLIEELSRLDEESMSEPVFILKHSTSCSISAMALGRLERKWSPKDNEKIKPYYLDLIRHRELSNEIAKRYGVVHESPQVLVIRKGQCVYNASHMEISFEALISVA